MCDFRVKSDLFQHHKTIKLKKRLGSDGVLSLIQLWAYAAVHKSSGILSGMDIEDIEIASGWCGEDGALVRAFLECGFLDETLDGYMLHDWSSHNLWVADSEERGNEARFASLAKHAPAAYAELKKRGVTSITESEYSDAVRQYGRRAKRSAAEDQAETRAAADGMRTHAGRSAEDVRPHAERSAPSPSPSPSPLPSPEPKDLKSKPKTCVSGEVAVGEYPSDFEEFWRVYPRRTDKAKAFRAWRKELKLGSPPSGMISAASNYARFCAANRRASEHIKHPSTFLGQDRPWLEWAEGVPAESRSSYERAAEDGPSLDGIWGRTLGDAGQVIDVMPAEVMD